MHIETPLTEPPYLHFSAQLTSVGIKQINLVALLISPNFTGPNGSNSGSKPSHIALVVSLKNSYPLFYRHVFHNVSLFGKSLSGPQCITRQCNCMVLPLWKLTSRPGAFLGGLIMTMRPAGFFTIPSSVSEYITSCCLLMGLEWVRTWCTAPKIESQYATATVDSVVDCHK